MRAPRYNERVSFPFARAATRFGLLLLTALLGAHCSTADPVVATAKKSKDAGSASSGAGPSSSSSSGTPAAGACTTEADCTGSAGTCKHWACASQRCAAMSDGDRCNACDSGAALRVHFYQVSQALAALVELPDGRNVLIDTADTPQRQYCGNACSAAHDHLIGKLSQDLAGARIDMLWITHPHSDHIGGAVEVLDLFDVDNFVDNGRDGTDSQVRYVHQKAAAEAAMIVVEPGREDIPLQASGGVTLAAIAPSVWLPACSTDRNECSILLRIDYCASSLLFVGDAETEEEALVDTRGPVTLLQVGHHGSDSSSSAAFLAQTQPKYAVISSGKQDEGINGSYCHPRSSTIEALTTALGGAGSETIRAFDGAISCRGDESAHWLDVPASDRLWATARDGDVVLTTTGDGMFTRE